MYNNYTRSLTGISKRYGHHQLKQHLKSDEHENELDELRITGSFLVHSSDLVKPHNILSEYDGNIDTMYSGRVLVFTQNLFTFNGNETQFKDLNINQGLTKVKFCEIENDENVAGVFFLNKVETNNKVLDINNRRYTFDDDKTFTEFCGRGECMAYIVYEPLSEIDLNVDIIQGNYTKYINGVEDGSAVIDCVGDSLVINETTNDGTIQSLQQQVTNLQNIIDELLSC